MSLTSISQFVLGFALAIGLLFASGMAATRYLLTRVATPPPRPTFPNDPSPVPPPAAPAASPADAPAAEAAPIASPSPSPATEGFAAKVNQPIGLILRQDPGVDAPQVGGVDFNQQVTVLQDSPDGGWQKIRLADGTEGWVKAGNTERIN